MDSFYKALVYALGLPSLVLTHHSTIYPLQDVVQYGDVAAFRERKNHEQQYTSIAIVTCLTAGIGVMQWPLMQNPYSWASPALVYCSIIEACFCGAITFHQRALLPSFTDPEHFLFNKDKLTWKTIYIWQTPNMMITWGAMFLLSGITFGICFALVPAQDHANDDRKTAIFVCAFFCLNFLHYTWYAFQLPVLSRPPHRSQVRAAWTRDVEEGPRRAMDLSKSSTTLVATNSMKSMA